MIQAADTLHEVNAKRRILIVDDEIINRSVLAAILEDEYEILQAADGVEALRIAEENCDTLSLIILDLIMPNMPGQEVLHRVGADPKTQHIPVIIASGDETQEVECLKSGATDFIKKPYPDAGIIKARVLRTIRLAEDRQTIQSAERDPLTGLYNSEFFYFYAEQYDHFHKDTEMDAIILDINHFSILNERHGRAYADDVLRRVGEKAREMVHDDGGIVCRVAADVFQVYCPHREDYKALLDNASVGLAGEENPNARVRLRMGVYSKVDKSLDMERRFDRARTAAATVRNSLTRNIGVYDDRLFKADLYAEQLIDDFQTALAEHQFKVFYQPKFDIRPDTPVLSSAEGLVRWEHPKLGMISPGVFIPLFEQNGLIQELDSYVWREAARQIREWKDRLGFSVPVSVNMSRIDMYDPSVVYTLQEILNDYRLDPQDLHLEITESAYTEESEQLVEMVRKLRLVGHLVEMDDFGSGYSSLNMLSEMPVDCLKLDMNFIRTAFSGEKDLHMITVIIGIADHLHVPVVAEGVETEEQLTSLREIGCDLVQGYYFSPPVPAEKFEVFLTERKEQTDREAEEMAASSSKSKRSVSALGEEKQNLRTRLGKAFNIPMNKAGTVFILLAFLTAGLLFLFDSLVTSGYLRMERASRNYISAQHSAYEMEMGSDNLTDQVRSFVVTGDPEYMEAYFTEAEVTRRRDWAVETLETLLNGTDNLAYSYLAESLRWSNELMELEYHAMKLTAEAEGMRPEDIPAVVQEWTLSPEEQRMSPDEKQAAAIELVYGAEYVRYKSQIRENASRCTDILIEESEKSSNGATENMRRLTTIQSILTITVIVLVAAIVAFIIIWIQNPINQMVRRMRAKGKVPPTGASELRYVAETYNEIYDDNKSTNDRLNYNATHDALTGLLNRSAYNIMSRDIELGHTALLLVDVDKFKSINDTYGHAVGDRLLKKVADMLQTSFRSVDMIFRIGGDEFVVIMTGVDSSMRDSLKAKIDQLNIMLQKPTDDLPPTSLSVGIAFADRENPEGDIFKDADTALYRVKAAGRCGCEIY